MRKLYIAVAIAAIAVFARAEKSDAERYASSEMNAASVKADNPAAGGVRVLFIGNSITLHGYLAKVGWTNVWGMAASSADRDYVHIVTRGLEQRLGKRANVKVRNFAEFERQYRTWDIDAGTRELVEFNPDYLVLALGENVPNLATDDDRRAYEESFGKLLGRFLANGRHPTTVVRGVFWPNPAKDNAMENSARKYGVAFAKAAFGVDETMTAKGLFWHSGVQSHPGDKGMEAIAKVVLEHLK